MTVQALIGTCSCSLVTVESTGDTSVAMPCAVTVGAGQETILAEPSRWRPFPQGMNWSSIEIDSQTDPVSGAATMVATRADLYHGLPVPIAPHSVNAPPSHADLLMDDVKIARLLRFSVGLAQTMGLQASWKFGADIWGVGVAFSLAQHPIDASRHDHGTTVETITMPARTFLVAIVPMAR